MVLKYADILWDHDETAHEQYMDNLAPIVLFTYNRLDHTQKTIEALKENMYAKESVLFIYSDAPRREQDVHSVQCVRDYLQTIDGFRDVHIIMREENWGLARNIIDGVTQIVNQYGKIIVLEDDIVTSKYFLKYMNDALSLYKNVSRVMSISGYMYPIKKDGLSESFFINTGYCWGWATWANAWSRFERNPEKLMQEFTRDDIYHFNLEGTADFWQQVVDNASGKLYTWAVFWDATLFQNRGLTLAPRESLTFNVGMDETGEHCSSTGLYDTVINQNPIQRFPVEIQESTLARERHRIFFGRQKPGLLRRLVRKGRNGIRRLFA